MTHETPPLISWGWTEGRVWDNWMIVHFLSGAVIAGVLMVAGTAPSYASIIALVLLTLWEFAEMAFGIDEEVENLVLDIIFGMLGFFTFSEYLVPMISPFHIDTATLILFILASLGSFLGWRARVKRGEGK